MEHISEIVTEIRTWIESDFDVNNPNIRMINDQIPAQGFMGDIIFARCSCTCQSEPITISVVLKCSQSDKVVRNTTPAKETFTNEIYFYEKVIPDLEKISGKLSYIPKYYGSLVWHNREVIILENLNDTGYKVNSPKSPLSGGDLRTVLASLGHFHATSAVLRLKQPDKFVRLTSGLQNMWKCFTKLIDQDVAMGNPVEQICALLQAELDQTSVDKLKALRRATKFTIEHLMIDKKDHFSVISHNDCWTNNFMFKYADDETQVMIIDWPCAKLSSPVIDLSCCIYSCSSSEDLEHFADLLETYYESFSKCLIGLDHDPKKIYEYPQLLEDWKLFGTFGLLITITATKLSVSDKDEVPDFAKIVREGGDMNLCFSGKTRNVEAWKNRMRPVIQHAIRYGVI